MGRKSYHGPQLSFSACNTKLEKTAKALGVRPSEYWGFDLRAGLTCPSAKDCHSYVNAVGKLTDGKHTKFRCYAATAESRLSCVLKLHNRNTKAIRQACKGSSYRRVADLIEANLPPKCKVIRIHTSGDFFNYTYFRGWIEVAKRHPKIRFYAYTKALPLLQKYVAEYPDETDLSMGILAHNVRITASKGGKHDHLIEGLQTRTACVIMKEEETQLPIDNDDTHAVHSGGSFALLIHATQPRGTIAAKNWDKIRRTRYTPRRGVPPV